MLETEIEKLLTIVQIITRRVTILCLKHQTRVYIDITLVLEQLNGILHKNLFVSSYS